MHKKLIHVILINQKFYRSAISEKCLVVQGTQLDYWLFEEWKKRSDELFELRKESLRATWAFYFQKKQKLASESCRGWLGLRFFFKFGSLKTIVKVLKSVRFSQYDTEKFILWKTKVFPNVKVYHSLRTQTRKGEGFVL